jgi:8-oxo-dGTP diphosphatase
MWEDFSETALRELQEEAGNLQVTTPEFLTIVNARFYDEKKHYVTIFMVCDWISGEAQVMEPKKCKEWQWFDYDNLPSPLMLGIQDIKDRGILEATLK